MSSTKPGTLMLLNNVYCPTLKEDPADAELASHRLLIRAGMMRKVSSGIYAFLPLGYSILRKIEQIVREEMNKIDCQELLMPILQPAELWHESGRWDEYGPELMRLNDRHDHSYTLGPTHEELITSLLRNELRSYKKLPVSLYQFQWKYRDEIRPRFGLMRSREFLMKDAYTFHASEESLNQHYGAQAEAYGRICNRLGLTWRAVKAGSGQIGGSESVEFMALADSGEASILYCKCGAAANTEVATAKIETTTYDVAFEKLATPGIETITALAAFLGIPEKATAKALCGRDKQGRVTILFVPGNRELSEAKAASYLGSFALLSDEEIKRCNITRGYVGPIGLAEDIRVVADTSLKTLPKWVVGANEAGYHYVGAALSTDFSIPEWADLLEIVAGDPCPLCGRPFRAARGIEVGQVFKLGAKYSDSMKAYYMDEDNIERPFLMGCYGWGLTRSLAAIVEQNHDDKGIIWPLSVCPAEIVVIPLTVGDDTVWPVAQKIVQSLVEKGIEVACDDRLERPGVKFSDADLIGWPSQLIVSERGVKAGIAEFKDRASNCRREIPLEMAVDILSESILNTRQMYDRAIPVVTPYP